MLCFALSPLLLLFHLDCLQPTKLDYRKFSVGQGGFGLLGLLASWNFWLDLFEEQSLRVDNLRYYCTKDTKSTCTMHLFVPTHVNPVIKESNCHTHTELGCMV